MLRHYFLFGWYSQIISELNITALKQSKETKKQNKTKNNKETKKQTNVETKHYKAFPSFVSYSTLFQRPPFKKGSSIDTFFPYFYFFFCVCLLGRFRFYFFFFFFCPVIWAIVFLSLPWSFLFCLTSVFSFSCCCCWGLCGFSHRLHLSNLLPVLLFHCGCAIWLTILIK